MSVPPSGNYYTAPGAAPQSSSAGCWKAAGIGCAIFAVLLIVGIALVAKVVYDGVKHPKKGSIFSVIADTTQAAKSGIQISRAVGRYHDQKRKYPDSLKQLVPNFLPNGNILHSNMDADSTDPKHVSFKYTKPAEGAPGDTPMLDLHYRIDIDGGGGKMQSQDAHMVFDVNGQTDRSQSSRRPRLLRPNN